MSSPRPVPPASRPSGALPDVAARIEDATPLPGHVYTDGAWLERERTAVFGRAWNLVAHADDLAEPGRYVAAAVGGEPIVLLRDGDVLRGFYNVCRHRGGPLVDGCGRQRQFTCRYHGWSYALDGRVLRAPLMTEELERHAGRLDLVPVRVERWANLVFASLDPAAPPLDDWFRGLTADAAHLRLDALHFHARRTYAVDANWKVYVDNYMEGYHVPAVHPGLSREIDFRRYVTELGHRWCVQHAPIAAGGGRVYTAEGHPEARYYWLYPNVMLNCYQGLMQVNVVEPDGPGRCRVHFDWYLASPPATDAERARFERMAAFSDEVQAEDAGICAAVHRNLGSRAYVPGPYSTQYETGVHQFHRLYADALREAAPDAAR